MTADDATRGATGTENPDAAVRWMLAAKLVEMCCSPEVPGLERVAGRC